MKLTALSVALIAALGMTAGCSTQNTMGQASRPAVSADAPAQYALGRYYQGQQRYELAIEAYRRALAANPAHAGAHNGLGASLLLAGRNAEAIDQFKAGLKQQPGSAALWNNLGYAYALSGENGLAEMAYKQSLNLDPTDIKTSTNLAVVQQAVAAPVAAAQTPTQVRPVQAAAVEEVLTVPVYPAQPGPATAPTAEAAPAQAAAEPIMVSLPMTKAAVVQTSAAPVAADEPEPSEPTVKLQPSTVLTAAPVAAPAVKLVEVAPRVYEMSLRDTNATAIAAAQSKPAPIAGTANISVPLRDAAIQMAAINTNDFALEIRNGNGVRHMALRTSRYLADYGYTTKRLTNQRGFSVRVTRVFYLPGYIEQASQLLAHLPKDTVLTETTNLRRGTHVRVVLGKDMVQHQAGLDAAKEKIQLAALQP